MDGLDEFLWPAQQPKSETRMESVYRLAQKAGIRLGHRVPDAILREAGYSEAEIKALHQMEQATGHLIEPFWMI